MRIRLHQDIFGHKSGETIDYDATQAKWAVKEGYASTAADADGVHATSVPAKNDPRLAENVKGDANPTLHEQIEAGVLTPGEPDKDEVYPTLQHPEDYHVPELTNGKGDPDKGEAGKAPLEAKAEKTDPEDAVEFTGTPESVEKANDATEKASVKADENPEVEAPEETVPGA
jgi:hypothetical protein